MRRHEREAANRGEFKKVFVKHLSEEQCSEGALGALFKAYGPITSVFVPRHKDGTPKGFAFVNFASSEMARRAVSEMHGRALGGVDRNDSAGVVSRGATGAHDRSDDANKERKLLCVCRAQKKSERESELRKKFSRIRRQHAERLERRNVYVKHLSPEVDARVLRAHFAPMGRITSCVVMRDARGLSRGFGFVCFATQAEARKAVHQRNGTFLCSKQLYIAIAQRKEARRAQLRAQHNAIEPRMTVAAAVGAARGNANVSMTSTIFSSGAVQAQTIAFVNIASSDTASGAVGEMHGRPLTTVIRNDSAGSASKATGNAHLRSDDANKERKPMYVRRAQKKSEGESELRKKSARFRRQQAEHRDGRNVYVKHLSPEVDTRVLRAHFAPMGRITSCVVMRDARGLSRGFGFVCFATRAEAIKATQQRNGTLLASKLLYVAIAQRKEVRPARRRAQHRMLVPSVTASAEVGVLTMDAFPPLSASVLHSYRSN